MISIAIFDVRRVRSLQASAYEAEAESETIDHVLVITLPLSIYTIPCASNGYCSGCGYTVPLAV
jgi:hypothetical protein